tara:strand:+ start:409 stop:1422 length:1014 start_codon:yes stop_codon:yes gene_type:complete
MLTCVGGELMPYTIKYLKNLKSLKIKIIGTDNDTNAVGKHFCDKFYNLPKGNNKSYIAKCTEIILKENISLVIPTSDEEALALSKKKSFFRDRNITIACVNYETLRVLNNKSKTYDALSKFGINTAEWDLIESRKLLIEKLNYYYEKHGGAVIKPILDRGARNIFIISKNRNNYIDNQNITNFDKVKDFLPILKKNNFIGNFLIMQELYYPVVDIDLFAWEGKPISIIPRKRNHPLLPNRGHKILNDKTLIKLGKKIVKEFNLSWLYDCDVMFDSNKRPVVIEINPRQSGSVAVSLAAGHKIYENLIKIFLRKKIQKEAKLREKLIIPYKFLEEVKY